MSKLDAPNFIFYENYSLNDPREEIKVKRQQSDVYKTGSKTFDVKPPVKQLLYFYYDLTFHFICEAG